MMTLERFENFGETFTPKISIRTTGQIGFSTGAVNKFEIKSYNYCELYYDPEDKKIGIKLTNAMESGISAKINMREIDCFISAKPFLDFYGIEYKPTKSYHGKIDEESGLIILDLNKPIIVHGRKE